MLHMILVILKIIGILLLALVLLLLLLLGSLLFVPVRYKVSVKKDEKDFGGRAFVSWLLHLASFSCEYRYGWERPLFEIRILGISLKRFLKKKEDPDGKIPKEEEDPDAGTSEREGEPGFEIPEEEEGPGFETPEQEEGPGFETPEEEESGIVTSEGEEASRTGTSEDEEEPDAGRWEDEADSGRVNGKHHRLREKLLSLKKFPERLLHKLKQKRRNLERMKKKLYSFLELLKEYEAGKTVKVLWEHIRYLARHFGFRRIKGFLRFGTGDPASTGELTGFIYLFLPARAEKFSLEPDFHDTALETDLEAEGYVRLVHLLITAVKIFGDKNMKKILRRLRSR